MFCYFSRIIQGTGGSIIVLYHLILYLSSILIYFNHFFITIKLCRLFKKGGTKITSLEKMYYRYRSFKKPRLNSSSSLYSDSSNSKLGHILEFTHLLRTFSKACIIILYHLKSYLSINLRYFY